MQIVDSQGITAGHVLSDPYGRVITNSLSDELQEAFVGTGSLVDTTTNLVHLGGGRFYDPELGRSLQPDPMGGPPVVPQSLNRYAATVVGQPGVAEATVSSGFGVISYLTGGTATGLNKAYGLQIARAITPRRYTQVYLGSYGDARISLDAPGGTASNPKFAKLLKSLEGHSLTVTDYNPGVRISGYTRNIRFRVPIKGADLAVEAGEIGRQFEPFGAVTFARPFMKGRLYGKVRIGFDDVARVKGALGPILDFGIGAYFQYLEDRNNPYLTPTQKGFRAGISGIGSAGTAYGIGVGLASVGCTATVYCGIAAGVIGTVIWVGIQTHIFEAIPFLRPADRDLKPLNTP
jgi:hypothetical protein